MAGGKYNKFTIILSELVAYNYIDDGLVSPGKRQFRQPPQTVAAKTNPCTPFENMESVCVCVCV